MRDRRPDTCARRHVRRHLDEEPLDLDRADDGVAFTWGYEIPVRHGKPRRAGGEQQP
jgi:hypothetical protein